MATDRINAFECAVSGAHAPPAQDEDEILGDLPVDWSRVVVTRRRENPEWALMRTAIAAHCEAQLANVDEERRESARPLARTVARAAFAAYAATTSRYLTDEIEVDVSAAGRAELDRLFGETS